MLIVEKNKKKVIFVLSACLMAMILGTTWASLDQSLGEALPLLWEKPWFQVTILDFYINQMILFFLLCFLEKTMGARVFWLILFVCFGSMGTCLYGIKMLLKKGS